MTNILVYDADAEKLTEVADNHDLSVADLVEVLMDYVPELEFD